MATVHHEFPPRGGGGVESDQAAPKVDGTASAKEYREA